MTDWHVRERLLLSDPARHGSFAVEGSDSPSLFVAGQEQLGLKLESSRGMLDVFVIDHAECGGKDEKGSERAGI